MIHVTERERQALQLMQAEIAEEPDVALRLAPTEPGQLGVFPDTERDNDHVVEHDGRAVLFVDREVVGALAGSTIDFEETSDGVRFTLSR